MLVFWPAVPGEIECCICARMQSSSLLGVRRTWCAAGTQYDASAPCPRRVPSPRKGPANSSLATWQERASLTFVAKVSEHRLLAKARVLSIRKDPQPEAVLHWSRCQIFVASLRPSGVAAASGAWWFRPWEHFQSERPVSRVHTQAVGGFWRQKLVQPRHAAPSPGKGCFCLALQQNRSLRDGQ